MKWIFSLLPYFLVLLVPIDSNAMSNPDRRIQLVGAVVDVSFSPDMDDRDLSVSRVQILDRIERSALAVASYFQGFPVSHLDIVVNPGGSQKVNGTAYSGSAPMIILHIGRHTTFADLEKDWVIVHEMVHLAFPPMRSRHNWIEEGLATYIEPIVRVRAGLMAEKEAWHWLLTGTPKGLPESGDRGLDFTSTWGRRYWGGAVYFLLADIKIREQTKNRFGIEDALRAIKVAGGTMQRPRTWSIVSTLEIGDRATKTSVMTQLYHQMKDKPMPVDLDAIWRRLGVSLKDNKVYFNEAAPQSWLRRSLISTNKSK